MSIANRIVTLLKEAGWTAYVLNSSKTNDWVMIYGHLAAENDHETPTPLFLDRNSTLEDLGKLLNYQ
tara:strand:- start:96 stop:296 length:201 start_codon:yes stop_codon:yes gene_type:complete